MSRLDILKDREQKMNDFRSQISQELKDFIIIGRKLSRTKDGKQFFTLAKRIYYDQTEYMLDNFYAYNNDPNYLARLNGEEYILRKIVLQFINQSNTNGSVSDTNSINDTNDINNQSLNNNNGE